MQMIIRPGCSGQIIKHQTKSNLEGLNGHTDPTGIQDKRSDFLKLNNF